MSDFVIENGMLKKYTGPGGDVVIPEEVDSIANHAFSGNKTLTGLSLPDCGICIGWRAFSNCSNLKQITVYPCQNPHTDRETTTFEAAAFEGCKNLGSVTFPTGALDIETSTFAYCLSLKTLHFTTAPTRIDAAAFLGCGEITAVLPEALCETTQDLPGALTKFRIQTSDRGLAALMLLQRGVAWKNWRARRKPEHPAQELEHMTALLRGQEPMDFKTGSAVAEFLSTFYKALPPAGMEAIMALYPSKKSKEMDALSDIRGLMRHLGRAVPEESPAEALVREVSERVIPHPDAHTAVKKGIHWKDSKTLCPREALVSLISCYAHEWDRCAVTVSGEISDTIMLKDGLRVKIQPDADAMAALLNPDELSVMLTKLAKGAKYRPYLLAWARYASETDVAAMTGNFKKLQRGTAKDRYLAENLEQALLLSDTRAAMLFYDQNDALERYAKMRNMTAMELRDTTMLPDFGFDADGVKRYDIGGNTVEVRINPDLSFRLTDTKKRKDIRSIPKKTDDPAKAEAAAKDFAEFKKTIKNFIKLRTELLCRMHITGEPVKPELWQRTYLEHPVIRHLTTHIVWMDETGKTFTILDGDTVDAGHNPVLPQGPVRVAHVLEMSAEDIQNWQHFLAGTGQAQLFEQVWEPVISWNSQEIPKRYSGVVISSADRNALKANLKRRGINVHSGEAMREFNARMWNYEFYSNNTMYLGKSLELAYQVEEATGNLTLGRATVGKAVNPHEMNAVLLELDRATVMAHITKDEAEYLTDPVLDAFSAAQIRAFSDAAAACGAVNCTAVLLNYKNEHYPEYDAIAEFLLEW